MFHAVHDQIEVVLHLDKVLRFIDSLPQRDRKVFSYEAQMTRLEEEIQRYKKLELGLYENFVAPHIPAHQLRHGFKVGAGDDGVVGVLHPHPV